MVRFLALLALPFVLVACGGPAEPRWAPEAAVQKAIYRHGGPYTLTLFTMTSTGTGAGMHSGLMINAPSQRVIFDPAGTFKLDFAPERNDVHFGITENVRKVYIDYYARETIDVNIQTVEVSPAQAEAALAAVKNYGAVPKAQCTWSISRILRGVPGFTAMRPTYFPKSAMEAFARTTGVAPIVISDDDADKNHNVLFQATEAFRAGAL